MNAQRIPVLMYHRVDEAGNAFERTYAVPPQRFRAQIRALAEKGCAAAFYWSRLNDRLGRRVA
jgi:hypothetical protein